MTRFDALRQRVTRAFADAFSAPPELVAAAPGRVNLIGEHTDYNDGFVLPCAIDHHTMIAISPRGDSEIRVIAADRASDGDQFPVMADFAGQEAEWKNHVRGIVASLRDRGHVLSGADIAIAGNIPQGAGLSSSASLGVALGRALTSISGDIGVDRAELALAAQAAENRYVGVACGIMDQLISARAEAQHALLIDCRSLGCQPVSIADGLGILIVHSGVARELTGSPYNVRRQQCETAARHYGVTALRDVTADQLVADRAGLEDICYRRARHVVTENARTVAAANALMHGDLAELTSLMAASHASMRDDFEISVAAIDGLVDLIAGHLGTNGGVRMTGGGFGGAVVVVARKSALDGVAQLFGKQYRSPAGEPAQLIPVEPSAGVRLL